MTTPQTLTPQQSRHFFSALDGFRGAFAIIVAIAHTYWLSHPHNTLLLKNGTVLIDMFFGLSGLLMYTIYKDYFTSFGRAKKFMQRRFARLYPLHLFMIGVFLLYDMARLVAQKVGISTLSEGEILPFSPGALDGWGSLFENLTMLNAMGLSDGLTFNPPSWTIGAEFYTYIIFVVFLFRMPLKRRLDSILIGVLVCLIYVNLSGVRPDMDITYDLGFARCIAGFFTGVLAAKTLEWLTPKAKNWSVGLFTALEVFILVAGYYVLIHLGGKMQFFVGLGTYAFMLIFAFDGGLISRFMSIKPFSYLAKISYSVYLTHAIFAFGFGIIINNFLGGVENAFVGDAWLLVYLASVIVFSHFSQKWIEVPGQKFFQNLSLPKKQVAKKT